MKRPMIDHKHAQVRYKSYIVGFVLSILTTLLAFFFVVNQVWPKETLIYVVLFIAAVQLVVQMVFFLHLGRGNKWKTITFWATMVVLLIIVVGTIWIMNNLNYNMMQMSPEEMYRYMSENEGI